MSNPLAEMGLPVAGQAPPPAVLQGNPLAEMGLPVLESAAMQPARAPVGAMESIEAGWQASGPGLYWRKRLPDLVLDPSLNKWWERALTGITQVGSELPLMIPSAIVGSIAGGVAGAAVTWPAAPAGAAVGGLLGAGAAMFAIPGGIRESLMQAYKPGGVQTAEEWWQAVRSVAATIAKEAGIGAATFGAGGVARGAAAAAIGASREAATAIGMGTAQAIGATAKVAGTADLAAQIVAMTSLPAALQGRIPDWQEFMDAAIVVGGLKTAHVVANRMMNVYRTTGKTPIEQVADANAKPGIKEELTKPEPPPADVLASGAPRFPDPIRVQEQMFAELAMKDAIRAGKPVEGEVPSPDLPAAQLLMSAKAESGRTEQPWTEKLVEKLANPEDPDRPAIFRMLFPEIAKAEEQPTTAREAAIWREARGEQGAAGKIEFPELGPRLEKFEQPLSEAQQKKVDQLEARITQLRKMVDSEALLKKDLDGLRERFTREIRNLDEPRIRNALEEFGPNYPETIAEIMVRSVEQRVRRLGKTVEEIYGGKFVSLRSGFWMLDPRLEIDANRKALEAEAQAIIVATPALKESTASLWTAIRELGGINIQHRSDIEKQTGKKAPPNVFTENGLPLDVLTVDLKARQWDVKTEDVDGGVQSLRDMIAAEIVEAGTALRMGDESIVAARDARDRARGAAEAIGKALGNKKMTPDEETVVRDFLDQIDSRKTEETKQAETIEMAERANRVSRETIERDGVKEWVDVARESGLGDGDIAAVVTAAPGDPQLQGIGMSYAMNGTEYGPAFASNLVRALKLLGVSKDKPEYTDAQMNEAMRLAKAAGLRQARVAEELADATKRFEDGVGDAKDIADLRQEQSRWQTWEEDKAVADELRAEMKKTEGGELAQGPREFFSLTPETPGELAARNKLAVEMARREVMEKRAEYRAQVEAEKVREQEYLEGQSTLFQKLAKEKRAAYDKASKVVTLFKTADRSSLIHEVMGHDWLEELRQDAGRPDAPAQIKADWNTAVAWLNTL